MNKLLSDMYQIEAFFAECIPGQIALVSQNVFLFPGFIAQNVAYGKIGAYREEIMDTCKKANVHDFIMQLPKGYETEMGERGARLSDGQKQRIPIARAFLKDAPILILDEAAAALSWEKKRYPNPASGCHFGLVKAVFTELNICLPSFYQWPLLMKDGYDISKTKKKSLCTV